jgi:hypothetical protein
MIEKRGNPHPVGTLVHYFDPGRTLIPRALVRHKRVLKPFGSIITKLPLRRVPFDVTTAAVALNSLAAQRRNQRVRERLFTTQEPVSRQYHQPKKSEGGKWVNSFHCRFLSSRSLRGSNRKYVCSEHPRVF